MTREQFIGIWKLVSYEFRLADGIMVRPMGQGVKGMLFYDASGYVSLHVMDPERPKFASGDWLKGTPEEIQAAFEGSMAYYGTFEFDASKGMMIHHIEGATYPNWIGVDRELFVELSGDRLTLTTLPMPLSGEQAVGYLIWKRLQ